MLKLKFNAWAYLAVLVGVLAVFGGVKAYQNFNTSPQTVIEHVENFNNAAPVVPFVTPVSEETSLGAVSSELSLGNKVCSNDSCVVSMVQSFQVGTTTLVAIPDPFVMVSTTGDVALYNDGMLGWTGATTTVDLVRLNVTTGPSTTWFATCGAAVSSTPTYVLMQTGIMPTSSPGVIENNVTAALGASVNGGTTAKIMLGHAYPMFACVVTASSTADVTRSDSTLTGKATVVFKRTRF